MADRGPVVMGDLDRVAEQRDGVSPVSRVGPCHGGVGAASGERERRHGRRRAAASDFGEAPDRDHGQPDQRDIHVAIGARLHADLHQSDHGDQNAGEPEPSCDEIGPPRALGNTSAVMAVRTAAAATLTRQADAAHRDTALPTSPARGTGECRQIGDQRVFDAKGERDFRGEETAPARC